MTERIDCPTCGHRFNRPFAAHVTWSDECACSDLGRCVSHQLDVLASPERPTDDAIAVRRRDALARRHAEFEEVKQRIEARRAADLTAEERKALRWVRQWMADCASDEDHKAWAIAASALDRLLGGGGR